RHRGEQAVRPQRAAGGATADGLEDVLRVPRPARGAAPCSPECGMWNAACGMRGCRLRGRAGGRGHGRGSRPGGGGGGAAGRPWAAHPAHRDRGAGAGGSTGAALSDDFVTVCIWCAVAHLLQSVVLGKGVPVGVAPMKRWQPPVFSLLSLFVALSPVWGNGAAPPRPVPLPEAKAVKFVVVVDERVTEPRLVVPKSMLGEKKSASLDLSTIVAGIALTLALVSGGLLLVRRGSPRIVAGALALSVLAFGATTLFAQSTNPGNTGATNINFNFNQAVRPAVVTPV